MPRAPQARSAPVSAFSLWTPWLPLALPTLLSVLLPSRGTMQPGSLTTSPPSHLTHHKGFLSLSERYSTEYDPPWASNWVKHTENGPTSKLVWVKCCIVRLSLRGSQ